MFLVNAGFMIGPAVVDESDGIRAIVDLLHLHPIVTAIVLLIVGVLVGVAIATVIVLSNKAIRELIAELVAKCGDSTIVAERDQALEESAAAEKALLSITADSELAKLALEIAEDTVRRFNRLRVGEPENEWQDARVHLLDWIQRIFGFSRSDINKVTLWMELRTDSGYLRPFTYTGISPESARELRLPIFPTVTTDDTFAAMAFRSKRSEVCADTETDLRYRRLGRPPRHPYRSLIAVPILSGRDVRGVLTVDSLFAGTFTNEDYQRLANLSTTLLALLIPALDLSNSPAQVVPSPRHE